jgi:hypothetical protein
MCGQTNSKDEFEKLRVGGKMNRKTQNLVANLRGLRENLDKVTVTFVDRAIIFRMEGMRRCGIGADFRSAHTAHWSPSSDQHFM